MLWFSFYSAISASILLKTGSISIPRTQTLSGPSLARYVFSIFSHYFLSFCTHLPLSSRSPRNAILSLCEYNQQLAHHTSTHSKHRSSFWSSQLSGSLFICNGYSSSCTWTPLSLSWYRSILFTCLDMMTLSLNGSKSMLTPYCPYLMIPIEWPSMITTRWNSSLRINTLFYASNNSYAPTPFLSSLGILFHPPKSWLRRPFYVNSRVWYGSWNDLQAIFSQSHSQFHYVVGCSYQSQAQF